MAGYNKQLIASMIGTKSTYKRSKGSSELNTVERFLNKLTSSRIIVINAGPGMGKTRLALGIASLMCRTNSRVAWASNRIPMFEIFSMLTTGAKHLDFVDDREFIWTNKDWTQYSINCGSLRTIPSWIIDSKSVEIERLVEKIKRVAIVSHGLDLVIIDDRQHIASRIEEYSCPTDDLKNLLKILQSLSLELFCPIIIVNQLPETAGENQSNQDKGSGRSGGWRMQQMDDRCQLIEWDDQKLESIGENRMSIDDNIDVAVGNGGIARFSTFKKGCGSR